MFQWEQDITEILLVIDLINKGKRVYKVVLGGELCDFFLGFEEILGIIK